MPRQRRTPAQWQSIIEVYENSGLSGSAFCQREGINPKSFYRAKARAGDLDKPNRFIQARATPLPQGEITIELPVGRITCSSAVPPQWVAGLLKALSQ